MQTFRERKLKKARSGFKLGMKMRHEEKVKMNQDGGYTIRGDVFFHLQDGKTKKTIEKRELKNLIVRDAGILIAALLKDPNEPAHGINMLAVGTGATGALLSPNAPDDKQRKLNAELERKAFSSTQFRDSGGGAVSIRTNIVDFTTTFAEAEAVGPLNEMSLLSTISDSPATKNPNPNSFPTYDPTVDTSLYDICVNYLTFATLSKPSSAILTITWRLSF